MLTYRTRVIFDGIFWRIERLRLDKWERMHTLFMTRREARDNRYWYAQL